MRISCTIALAAALTLAWSWAEAKEPVPAPNGSDCTLKHPSHDLLSLKLFKDATPVVLRAQAAMIWGALRLFVLAIVPMLVMMVPVLLMLGQLSLWYQHRPLRVGEEAVVALKLNGNSGAPMPPIRAEPVGAGLPPGDGATITSRCL